MYNKIVIVTSTCTIYKLGWTDTLTEHTEVTYRYDMTDCLVFRIRQFGNILQNGGHLYIGTALENIDPTLKKNIAMALVNIDTVLR